MNENFEFIDWYSRKTNKLKFNKGFIVKISLLKYK